MWAKMPDKAFISKDGRNAEAMPAKLEPQNLKMYLDAPSFYHVQGLVETQNNKQLFYFFFFEQLKYFRPSCTDSFWSSAQSISDLFI